MSDTLDPVRVVDADTHLTEQHDLWTRRAPPAFKDRVPHVTQVDGSATWVVEDNVVLGRAGAGGVIDTNGVKGRSFEGLYEWELEQAHAAASRSRGPPGAPRRDRHLGTDHLSRCGRAGWAVTGREGEGRHAAQAVRRDLQRRQRRAPVGIGRPAPARWPSCRHGTSMPVSTRPAAPPASASGASTSPRTPRTWALPTWPVEPGTRSGMRAAHCRCRCTSTSGPA